MPVLLFPRFAYTEIFSLWSLGKYSLFKTFLFLFYFIFWYENVITNKSGHKIWPLFVLIVQLEFELDIMGLVVDT